MMSSTTFARSFRSQVPFALLLFLLLFCNANAPSVISSVSAAVSAAGSSSESVQKVTSKTSKSESTDESDVSDPTSVLDLLHSVLTSIVKRTKVQAVIHGPVDPNKDGGRRFETTINLRTPPEWVHHYQSDSPDRSSSLKDNTDSDSRHSPTDLIISPSSSAYLRNKFSLLHHEFTKKRGARVGYDPDSFDLVWKELVVMGKKGKNVSGNENAKSSGQKQSSGETGEAMQAVIVNSENKAPTISLVIQTQEDAGILNTAILELAKKKDGEILESMGELWGGISGAVRHMLLEDWNKASGTESSKEQHGLLDKLSKTKITDMTTNKVIARWQAGLRSEVKRAAVPAATQGGNLKSESGSVHSPPPILLVTLRFALRRPRGGRSNFFDTINNLASIQLDGEARGNSNTNRANANTNTNRNDAKDPDSISRQRKRDSDSSTRLSRLLDSDGEEVDHGDGDLNFDYSLPDGDAEHPHGDHHNDHYDLPDNEEDSFETGWQRAVFFYLGIEISNSFARSLSLTGGSSAGGYSSGSSGGSSDSSSSITSLLSTAAAITIIFLIIGFAFYEKCVKGWKRGETLAENIAERSKGKERSMRSPTTPSMRSPSMRSRSPSSSKKKESGNKSTTAMKKKTAKDRNDSPVKRQGVGESVKVTNLLKGVNGTYKRLVSRMDDQHSHASPLFAKGLNTNNEVRLQQLSVSSKWVFVKMGGKGSGVRLVESVEGAPDPCSLADWKILESGDIRYDVGLKGA